MRHGDDVMGCAQTYVKRFTVRTRHLGFCIVCISSIKMEGKCVMLGETIKAHIILVWSPNEEIACERDV